jgi:hypothetical protein
MAHDPDSDRHALIQALHAAARLERAQAMRRMLRGLLRRTGSKRPAKILALAGSL